MIRKGGVTVRMKETLKEALVWIKSYKWISIIISSMILLSLLGYLFIIFGGRFIFDEKATILPQSSKVVAQDGTILGKLYTENRDYVTLEEVPDHVEEAFIAMEDQRFYDHAGISFPAVARAVYRDILTMSKVEGGSTITQQLAKNLFLVNDKTWMRKTKEVMASIYLERNYSKKQILELYVNQIYFAHGIYGVGTAADYFFGKHIGDVTMEEGALLAAMVKAPNTYSPYHDIEKAKERRDLVFSQMEASGKLSTEEMLSLQNSEIRVVEQEELRDPWLDDYFSYVLEEAEQVHGLSREALKKGGYTIEVHMDPTIQQIAYEEMQKEEFYPGSNDKIDGSFVLMEQQTGNLKALIAGRDFTLTDSNHLLIPKQPGSLMKPIAVYGPAMQLGDFQAYDMIPDENMEYDGYQVENADGNYQGEISLYEALVNSKNTSSVWLLDQIGIGYSKSFLEKMNMPITDTGLAIALGGLKEGLTPVQLTESYRTFIHDGEWLKSTSIAAIYNRKGEQLTAEEQSKEQVFDPQVAWNMVRMLESTVKEGTATAGDYTKALAGKTGSTQHPIVDGEVKDAWFAGFTPGYVVTAWIGYDQATEDNYVTTGSEAPTRLTKSILTEMEKRFSLEETFAVPDEINDLDKPIELPTITDLTASMEWGGVTVLHGELNWTKSPDERVVYRIYEVNEGEEEWVGEVKGKDSYIIRRISVFRSREYYIVPYNPLTGQEGEKSNHVFLEFDF